MTAAEWKVQWKRLDQFHVSADANRADVSAEWFRQLQHWHVDAIDHGITKLIGTAKDTFLPGLGLLKGFIQERVDRHDRTRDKCPTCQGTTWIEAAPWKSNSRIYTGFQRCPDCGVPAPEYKPVGHREELTAVEYQAWRDGTFQEPAMHFVKSNHAALEALLHLDAKRGVTRKMAKAIEGAPKAPSEVA